MEKQLLFLLEWDLNISEDDLLFHLEPFLAPIRLEIQRQEEHARIREQKKAASREQRLLEEEAARHYQQGSEFCVYEEKYVQYYEGSYVDPCGEIVRTRYDSPPSSIDVPDLTYSGNGETFSSSISSGSSYVSQISRSGTPASSIYADENEVMYDDSLTAQYSEGSSHVLRDIVHVHIANQHSGSSKHVMLPYEIEREEMVEKPVKKPRLMGGNILSRFLTGQQR
jgi:hypothetical protein